MNPNILTQELINFIEKLRAADYHIGATQYIAAQDLILGLAAQRKLPPKLTGLRALLAPILCHSPKEQAAFKTHFDEWIETVEPTDIPKPPIVNDPPKSIQIWKWAFIVFVIVFISIITYVYWTDITNLFQGKTNPTPSEITAPIDKTAQPKPAPVEIAQPEPTSAEIAPSDPVPPTEKPQKVAPTAQPESSPLWNILSSTWAIGVVLPLFVVLLLWLWQKRPRFLTRKSTSTPPEIKKLFVEGIDDKLFQSVGLSRAAQQLHKRTRTSVTQLDIEATIEKTSQTAGWLALITDYVKSYPKYLVLIDRTTFKDHQSQLMNSLINQLIVQGLFVTRYYFDAEPRRCYPEKVNLAPLTLTELAERYPEHRLMIFSDGNGLIDPITGELVNWIEQFSVWTHRVLFTLETPEQWGYREQILDDADFLIMPANEAGLTELAKQINTEIWQSYPKPSCSFPIAFPESLTERPRRWLERHAPDAPVLTELSTEA